MQGNKVITIKARGKRNDWMESSVGKQRQGMICNKPLHVLPRGKTEKKTEENGKKPVANQQPGKAVLSKNVTMELHKKRHMKDICSTGSKPYNWLWIRKA